MHRLYVVMILKKLKWLKIDFTQLETVLTKASEQIKRLGRSVSQRRMPRETEKLPLTMIDEKLTDGTHTNKKDQDGHGMMKSEIFWRGSLQTLTESRRRIEEFFCQMVMEWWMLIFVSTVFPIFFWVSYTCSGDYSVYDGGCTYTHL